MVEKICPLLSKKKKEGKAINVIRCDNAGENRKLEEVANGQTYALGIQFEYTPPNTPQHNGKAERGLTVIAARGRTMMFGANLNQQQRLLLFPHEAES